MTLNNLPSGDGMKPAFDGLFKIAAWGCLVFGVIGLIQGILPGVPLLLVAAWYFYRAYPPVQRFLGEAQPVKFGNQDARDISREYGCLTAFFIVAAVLTGLVFLSGINIAAKPYGVEKSQYFFTIAISSAVSLAILFVFVRILRAIHTLLVLILKRLDSLGDQK